jgi:hypothetical protein
VLRTASTFALAGLALFAVSCGGKRQRYFIRVVEPTGRAYYTHSDKALYTESGGFVTFRDLVTKESVHLVNGKYSAAACPQGEVEKAQVDYLGNPRAKPKAEYVRGQGMDGEVWQERSN